MRYFIIISLLIALSPLASAQDKDYERFPNPTGQDQISVSAEGGAFIFQDLVWAKHWLYKTPSLFGSIVNKTDSDWTEVIFEVNLFDRTQKRLTGVFDGVGPTILVKDIKKNESVPINQFGSRFPIGRDFIGVKAEEIASIEIKFKSGIPKRETFRHNVKISSEYDRFKDQTVVSIEPIQLTGSKTEGGLSMWVGFSYPGTTKPSSLLGVLMFVYASKSGLPPKFADNKESIILADGARYFFNQLALDKTDKTPKGGTVEMLGYAVSLSDLSRIVFAKTVEARVSSIEIKFTEEQLEALRDLASRLQR